MFFNDDKDLRSYIAALQHSPSAHVAMTASAFIAKNYRNSVRNLEQELDEFISEIDFYDDKLGIVKRTTTHYDPNLRSFKKMTTL